MSIIAVGSAKASPGVTSLSVGLGLSWEATTGRRAILVEADGDGGVLAARFGLALIPSLVEFSGTTRHELTIGRLQASSQLLAGQLPALVAPGCGETTTLVLGPMAKRLADGFGRLDDIAAVVDIGRVRSHSPADELVKHCDLLVLVARPRFDHLVPLVHQARRIIAHDIPTALVCVGDRPYPPTEMAKASQLDLLGIMAYEPRVVQALRGGLPANRRHRRLLLWRTLAELVHRIHFRLQTPTAGHAAA
ncbi:MAG: CpsD/CapB family tyrosine-protein kinase [Acidimicrobiia bacterium]|nr:CpsD/CapB family tyrosine-protein kinase [Acidimicrobiia bacterium]